MTIVVFKSIISLFFIFLSIVINYLIFCKNIKNKFTFVCIICFIFNIFYFIVDYFIYKNLLVDYIAYILLLNFLLSIVFEDFYKKLIDTRVVVLFFISFLFYRIIFLNLTIFFKGLIGFALSLIIMLIAYFVKKDSIGFGDVEVIAACGMIIGFPNIFHFLFKAFLFVFLAGVFLTITKKKKLLSELPLAPFLLLATII